MALRFSSGLLTGLQQYGQGGGIPADPRQRNAMQAAGVTNPLLQQFGMGLGGMLGTEMRSPAAIQQAEVSDRSQKARSILSEAVVSSPTKQLELAQQLLKIEGYENQALSLIEAAKASQKEQTKADASSSFKSSLAETLRNKGQNGFATVVEKVSDFSTLPSEAQNRILTAAGIADPEDQRKAQSTEGKIAVDLGLGVGTPEFQNKVKELVDEGKAGVYTEAFNAIHGTVKDVADISKNLKITDAVVAIEAGGKAGAEALQENTIIDLFGSKLRAEAAVKRFSQSASLPRRVLDSVSQWATGEKTELTAEDREAIIYAALQVQKETLDGSVYNAASALKIPREEAEAVRSIYNLPASVQEWERRFEKKFLEEREKKKEEPVDYVTKYVNEARNQAAR